MMAEVSAAVVDSPNGNDTPGLRTLGADTNATEALSSVYNVNETVENESFESVDHPTEKLRTDMNTNETVESDTQAFGTLRSGTPETESFGDNSPNEETLRDATTTEPSLDGPTESANHIGPAVVPDCKSPRLYVTEDKDLDVETAQDILGSLADTEGPHEKASPLPLTLVGVHQIESVSSNTAIATLLDTTENSAEEDVAAGCRPVPSAPEVISTSAFANEPQKNEEDDDEATRVKFEPREKCSDVEQAVEILKTSCRLSDVTIRKNMITWSCWNIADVIRGPHKETTWWQGRSRSRRMDAKSDELQDVIAEELLDEKEFDQEMAELCRQIDKRDSELEQILDEILQVAKQNNVHLNTAQTDPIEVLDDQTTKTRGTSTTGQGQQTAPDIDSNSTEALDKRRNFFPSMMKAIRRRFSRRSRIKKTK